MFSTVDKKEMKEIVIVFIYQQEQHQQLIKIHQSAKQQLNDMENIRDQQQAMSFANNENGMPDYDNPEDIQNDVESMLNRMKILTDFIQNQNELASFFGEKGEMVEEQMQLQQKLTELKNRKQQMSNLVNELQTMNGETKQNYPSSQVNIKFKKQNFFLSTKCMALCYRLEIKLP